MKAKKLWSVALVLALSFALCVPSFATYTANPTAGTVTPATVSEAPGSATVSINAEVALPTISVTIAAPAGLVVNPYGLVVSTSDGSATISGNDSVISAPAEISSTSTTQIKVSATATATVSAGIELVSSSALTSTSPSPSLFLELLMRNLTGSETAASLSAIDGAAGRTTVVKSGETATAISITMGAADESNPAKAAYLLAGQTGMGTGTGAWNSISPTVAVSVVFDITTVNA